MAGNIGQGNTPFAHQPAVVKQVQSRRFPVTKVVSEQMVMRCTAGDLGEQMFVPPSVVNVQGYTQIWICKALGQIIGLGEGIYG